MTNKEIQTEEQISLTKYEAIRDFTYEFSALVEEQKKANDSYKNTLKYDPILITNGVDIVYKYIDQIGKHIFFNMFTRLIATTQVGKLEEKYIIRSFEYIGMCILSYIETGIKKPFPSNWFD